MKSLVERLRGYELVAHDGSPLHPAICDEAADEIEKLLADKAAISHTASDYLHEIDRLRLHEIDRLRPK